MNGENCANIADLISGGNGSGGDGGGNGYTVVTGSNGTRCTFEDGKFNCNNATPAGGNLDVKGENGKRCKYVCVSESNGKQTCGIQCLADAPTGGNGNSVTIGGDSGKICTKVNDTGIECNLDADSLGGTTTINTPSGSGISIGGTDGYLCTKNGSTSLKCTINPATLGGGDSYWKMVGTELSPNLSNRETYTISLNPGNGNGGARSHILFDAKGIRINNGVNIDTGAGISVGGKIAAGNTAQNNYIYIYATGQNNDTNKRFEIFGSQKLAVGTSGGSYIYFMEKTNNNTLRVGLNTTTPQATLDVKGGIKVSDNCEPRTCDSNRIGTITYDTSKGFLGCKKIVNGVTTTYKRVSLDGGTWSGTSLPSALNCVVATYTNASQILSQ